MIPFPVHLFVILCVFECIKTYDHDINFFCFTTALRGIKSYHDFSHSTFHVLCHCNVRHNGGFSGKYGNLFLESISSFL